MKSCYFCGSSDIYTEIPVNESGKSESTYPKAPVCKECYVENTEDGADIIIGEDIDARVHDDKLDF